MPLVSLDLLCWDVQTYSAMFWWRHRATICTLFRPLTYEWITYKGKSRSLLCQTGYEHTVCICGILQLALKIQVISIRWSLSVITVFNVTEQHSSDITGHTALMLCSFISVFILMCLWLCNCLYIWMSECHPACKWTAPITFSKWHVSQMNVAMYLHRCVSRV